MYIQQTVLCRQLQLRELFTGCSGRARTQWEEWYVDGADPGDDVLRNLRVMHVWPRQANTETSLSTKGGVCVTKPSNDKKDYWLLSYVLWICLC